LVSVTQVLPALGFTRNSSEIIRDIYIPRYYEPRIDARLAELSKTHELFRLGDLIDDGHITVHRGHDIGKHHYGGGPIPYVRTSDIATWEVVGAPKQTVSRETYEEYQAKQDVRVGDVLFICDGLYLIGRCALITTHDLPCIHQSHLIRFRAQPSSPVNVNLLIAALSTPVVRWQVRSKQFTAGIIDKIEDRYRELVLPIPASKEDRAQIGRKVAGLIGRRAALRDELDRLPLQVQGIAKSRAEHVGDEAKLTASVNETLLGFLQSSRDVIGNILLPKYYSPGLQTALRNLAPTHDLPTIQHLVDSGRLAVTTGLEVGKLAYGTGEVPFVRTSDLANWELAGQPKQRVSETLYHSLKAKTDLRAGDILLVRDGTYLVGTSAILTESDAKALYAGGLYRLRCLDHDQLDPYLLLCVLNTPVVKLQLRSKQFTRDIIDTLGRRLFEIRVPIPKNASVRNMIGEKVRDIVNERVQLRDLAKDLAVAMEMEGALPDDEKEIATSLLL
jgi:hypothetical protein